ncbi:MAG: PQQ-like beta-propeller repeat protein [candidate division WOR-3 bacterium]|nr:MAG: PQQ-like beta-propeller repeat protein [candidate division WOR-3 bacterium]
MGLRRCLLPGLLMLPAVLSLSCKTQTANLPPDTPELVSSGTIVLKGSAVSYSATATDPDGGAVSFRFSWGDGDTSDWSLWVASGDTAAETHAWADTGTFVTTAQARDEEDALSGWSQQCSVSVALTIPGRVRWRCALPGWTFAAPSVGPDGIIYVLDRYDGLTALSQSGSILWTSREFEGATGSPVVGPDSVLYLGGGFAAGHKGRLIWHVESIPDLDRMPALGADGTIHYGRAALNPDGTVQWEFAQPFRFTGLAIGSDGTVYFGAWMADTMFLFALNPDGRVRWRYDVESYSWFDSPAIGPEGNTYIAVEDVGLHAIDQEGRLKWRFEVEYLDPNPVVVSGDGTVFCFNWSSDLLYALEPGGTLKWRFATKEGIAGAPVVAADGTVYVADDGGAIHALDRNGTRLWTCETGSDIRTPLTLGPDGTVYFGDSDGYLVAVSGSSPPSKDGWPMLGHDPQHTGRAAGP